MRLIISITSIFVLLSYSLSAHNIELQRALVTSSIIWRGDFNTCDSSQWTGHQYLQGDFAAVTSPVNEGRCAGRFVVHPDDSPINPGSGEERAEVDEKSASTVAREGQERFYAWSTYFPKGDSVLGDINPVSGHQNTFTQWHGDGHGENSNVFLDIDDNHTQAYSFVVGVVGGDHQNPTRPSNMDSHHHYAMAPATYNQWTNWEVHVFWSTDPTKGFVEIKLNGKLVYPKTYTSTLYTNSTAYLKQGFYRINRDTPLFSLTSTIYHEGMRIGTDEFMVTRSPAPGLFSFPRSSASAGNGFASAGTL